MSPSDISITGPEGQGDAGYATCRGRPVSFDYDNLAVDLAEAARSAAERIKARTAAGKRI